MGKRECAVVVWRGVGLMSICGLLMVFTGVICSTVRQGGKLFSGRFFRRGEVPFATLAVVGLKGCIFCLVRSFDNCAGATLYGGTL